MPCMYACMYGCMCVFMCVRSLPLPSLSLPFSLTLRTGCGGRKFSSAVCPNQIHGRRGTRRCSRLAGDGGQQFVAALVKKSQCRCMHTWAANDHTACNVRSFLCIVANDVPLGHIVQVQNVRQASCRACEDDHHRSGKLHVAAVQSKRVVAKLLVLT